MKRNPGVLRPEFVLAVLGVALLVALMLRRQVAVRPPYSSPAKPELWYWHNSFLISDTAVLDSEALIDRAARCGYTGVAFWENSFNYLSTPGWDPANVRRLRAVLQYALSRGMKVMALGAPFGYSNIALIGDGNLAEAQRVIGTRFRVEPNGRDLRVVNQMPPVRNAGFEDGKSAWFDTGDAGVNVSREVSHSGRSAGVLVDPGGKARFRQPLQLTPWRQYHLGIWVKSRDFRGTPVVMEVIDRWRRNRTVFYAELELNSSGDWQKFDFSFDSRDFGAAYLYFGTWAAGSGVLWFDDVVLEETGPVYVVRREGAPLRIYDPEDARHAYREGQDFDPVYDPALAPPRAAFRDNYHEPRVITLPSSTTLRAGQEVAMDYYAAFPMPKDDQMGMCLSAPGVFTWLQHNAGQLKAILPPHSDVLLSYDEMRQMNSCALCRSKHLSAGGLLAANIERTAGIYQHAIPDAEFYAWSDMFDPYHNAHDHYYYVEGNIAGSWAGVPSSVGILNWNHPHLPESLRWFSGLDSRQPVPHKQILAGYYDSGNGGSAESDLLLAQGVPGVQGIMYVSWRSDYSQLEAFARSARKGWEGYWKSLHASGS